MPVIMVSNHICIESCFTGRTSDKFAIDCFFCEKRFNSRCFELSTQQKMLSSTNNVLFMCYKCIDRVTKLKQITRRSNESSTAVNLTRNNEASNPNAASSDRDDKVTMSKFLSMLTKMDESLIQLATSNEELKQRFPMSNPVDPSAIMTEFSTINQNVINLHAKVDHGTKLRSEFEAQITSSMMEKLNDLRNKINVPPSPATSHTCTTTSKNNYNKLSTTLDPLNWSFSFNQSILPNENSELYQLLHGFEQNTWTSFDYLCRKLNENTDAVLHIESFCKEFKVKNTTQQLCSPVMDSIAIDNLNLINEKCGNIEETLLELNTNVKVLQTDTNDNDQLTQQLRSRFLKLIDADTEINDVERCNLFTESNSTATDSAIKDSTDDLSRYLASAGADKFGELSVISQRCFRQSTIFENNASTTSTLNDLSCTTVDQSSTSALQTHQLSSPPAPSATSTSVANNVNIMPKVTIRNLNSATPVHTDNDAINKQSEDGPLPKQIATIQPNAKSAQKNSDAIQRSLHLLGPNVNSTTLNNQYHLSPIDVNVTPQHIVDYITDNACVNKKQIKVHRLTKTGQDISTLSYITLKVETTAEIGDLIAKSNFWPDHIRIKPWIAKSTTTSMASSFLANKLT